MKIETLPRFALFWALAFFAQSIVVASPPSSPIELEIVQVDGNSITLNWTDVANDETHYVIQEHHKFGNEPWTPYTNVVQLDADSESFEFSVDHEVASRYQFRVRSYRGNAGSGWLNSDSVYFDAIIPGTEMPTVSIVHPNSVESFIEGYEIYFSGSSIDPDGSGLIYEWSSDRDGVFANTANVRYHGLSVGVHAVTLRVTDMSGNSAFSSITVTISEFIQAEFNSVEAETFDGSHGITIEGNKRVSGFDTDDYFYFEGVDLTGAAAIKVVYASPRESAHLDVRIDSPDGDLVAICELEKTVDWSIDNQNETVFELGLVTGVHDLYFIGGEGVPNIAKIDRFELIADTSPLQNQNPFVDIVAPSWGQMFGIGDSIDFNATASDWEGDPLTYEWRSDIDGVFAMTENTSYANLSEGTHVITLKVSDDKGLSTEQSLRIDVDTDPEPILTLTDGFTMEGITDGTVISPPVPISITDVSAYRGVKATITNTTDARCRVMMQFGNQWQGMESTANLEAGETRELTVIFRRNRSSLVANHAYEEYFGNMRGAPGGNVTHWNTWDFASNPANVQFTVFGADPVNLEIRGIRAYGTYTPPVGIAGNPSFYPFVDQFGQYKHDDWPDKTQTEQDLWDAIIIEDADLNEHPAPLDRNQYGGWIGAEAPIIPNTGDTTGIFRVHQFPDGKWTLVDPENRIFWSIGATGIGNAEAKTQVEGRVSPHDGEQSYFEWVPVVDSSLSDYDPDYAPFYVADDKDFTVAGDKKDTYAFGSSNLRRKYGEDWEADARDIALRRTLSWGWNTLGAWSDEYISGGSESTIANQVPYTIYLGWGLPSIYTWAGSRTISFPNPFASNFANVAYQRVLYMEDRLASEWCIGYFFGNEFHFRANGSDNAYRVAEGYLRIDDSNTTLLPSKEIFMNWMKAYYNDDINELNQEWGSSHASWADVRALESIPVGGHDFAKAWEVYYADALYGTIKTEADKVTNKMFLGSRFIDYTPTHIVQAAAEHMDVVTINWYHDSPDEIKLRMMPDVDKPILIGEFHFGSVDRGYFYDGLRGVGNQTDRARAYQDYICDALVHPNIVGAHWFQYGAQAFTGRKDGEAFQIGMLDVADTPYPETRSAARLLGEHLYNLRASDNTTEHMLEASH